MQRVRRDRFLEAEESEEGAIDLGALVLGLRRRKAWIFGITLAAFLATTLIVSLVPPRYTADAKVLIETQNDYFTRPDKAVPEPAPAIDPEAVQSQVQLVTSRDLARQAVRRLSLVGNAEFDPLANGMSLGTRVLVLFGLQRDPRQMAPEDRVLDTYYDRLTVFPVAKTRVLQIEFTSRDPELAAKAANTIADLYLDAQEEAKKETAKSAGDWLAPNIAALRNKVAEAEAKVAAFRAKTGILVGNNNTTISAQQLADLTTQLATARSQQADAQAKAKLIRDLIREGRIGEISDVANNELIRGIAQQRVALRAQLALESRTLLPGHPRMQELKAQLADIDNALRDAAEKVARGLENDARIAGARVDALSKTLEAQKQAAATDDSDEVELRALERDATAARDQLESFLQKYGDATARNADNASPPDARIISRAVAPELPSFPKKVPTIIIGTIAGFLLSLSIATARELMSGGAVRPSGRALPVPQPAGAAAAFGRRHAPASLPVEPEPSAPSPSDGGASPAEEEQQAAPEDETAQLVSHVRRIKPEVHAACVLVCGIDRGSGATAVAIELARALAADGRAVIIDFDEGGPGLDRFVGEGTPPGLAELVAGDCSFTDVIHRDRGSRLHMLPAGHREHASFDEERLHLIIEALAATYDYVVLDGPPLADNDRALGLAGWTEVAVLVTAGGKHDLDTRVAVDTLMDAGAVDVQVVAAESEPVAEEQRSAA